ncbi:MAG: hypothetical protein ABJM86_05940 [Hyphomicrobiales bacterium]
MIARPTKTIINLLALFALIPAQIATNAYAQTELEIIETASDLIDHCHNARVQTAKAISISQDAEVVLDDGRHLKFADIFFPRTSTDNQIPKETIQFLKSHLASKTITFLASQKPDRYRRIPAQIIVNNVDGSKKWSQSHIIKSGKGLFMPEPQKKPRKDYCDSDDLKQALQQHEKQNTSHKNKHPLAPLYASHNKVLWQLEGDFAIIEGVVLKTHSSKNNIFLNFGDEWKSDFTAVISGDSKGSLQKHFKSVSNLMGKRLKLRGFIDIYNGPSMRIDHPLQIEMLHE